MKSLSFESSQTLFFLSTLISILVLWASTRICLLNAAYRAWLAYIFKLCISSHDPVLKVSALRSQINFSYIIFPCWSCCDWIKRSKLGNMYLNSRFQNIEAGNACWRHSSPCIPRMQRDACLPGALLPLLFRLGCQPTERCHPDSWQIFLLSYSSQRYTLLI